MMEKNKIIIVGTGAMRTAIISQAKAHNLDVDFVEASDHRAEMLNRFKPEPIPIVAMPDFPVFQAPLTRKERRDLERKSTKIKT